MQDLIDEIDRCQFLFLQELKEGPDNHLVLILLEANSSSKSEDVVVPGSIIRDVHPIESDGSSRIYELIFPDYVAYSVRNESFTSADNTEQWQGRLFRKYSASKFLDYVRRSTFSIESHRHALTHYGIICGDHIIDIATRTPPRIMRVPGFVGPA